MKKLISVLLAVLMLLSISVCAFAADPEEEEEEPKQSPVQEEPGAAATQPAASTNAGGGDWWAPAAAAADDKADEKAVEEAEAAEAEAVADLEAVTVEGEDAAAEEGQEAAAADEGKEEGKIIVWLGKKTNEGTEQMEKDWKDLLKDLVAATAKLVKTDASKLIESVGDKAAVAGAPFRAVASEYPVTVTIKAPDNFAGILSFADGKWSELDCTVTGETVSFVLAQPSIFSLVCTVEEAP